MNVYTKELIKSEAKEMSEAKDYETYKWRSGYIYGIINALWHEDIITDEEYKEAKLVISHYDDIYWDKAKNDFASAHRRIFPEQ